MNDIDFLEELISIPSFSGQEDALAECLLARMAGLGFRVCRDGAGNALGVVGEESAEREIALVGHMDTVPGIVSVRRDDGQLHGRGAVDAKGPLAAFVLAASRVAPRLDGTRIVVIGTVDEEGRGIGARHLARTMTPPACCIIGEPSGWEGVTLGYKGMLSLDHWTSQPSGHTAGPRPAPAERAIDLWNKVRCYCEAYNAPIPGHFDTLDASLRAMSTSSDGLEDKVCMSISVRLPPGFQAEWLKRRLESWCPEGRFVFHTSDPPIKVSKNTLVARALVGAIRAEGGKPRFKLKTGTSDMNIVGPVWGCPIVAYGPGDSTLDHTPEEHLELQEFRKSVEVLCRALERVALPS